MAKKKKVDVTKRVKVKKNSVADVEILPTKNNNSDSDGSGYVAEETVTRRRVYRADTARHAVNTRVGKAEDMLMSETNVGTEEWNERDFIVPGSSTRGERERVWFSVMPSMKSITAQIIQNRMFPYRTIGELMRHALLRHLVYLSKLDRSVPSTLIHTQIIIDQCADDVFRTRFLEVFDVLRRAIRELRDAGMDDLVYERCVKTRGQLETIPDKVWRVKYLQEFDREFGKWLKVKNVDLNKRAVKGDGVSKGKGKGKDKGKGKGKERGKDTKK